jgi:hypothetical protein
MRNASSTSSSAIGDSSTSDHPSRPQVDDDGQIQLDGTEFVATESFELPHCPPGNCPIKMAAYGIERRAVESTVSTRRHCRSEVREDTAILIVVSSRSESVTRKIQLDVIVLFLSMEVFTIDDPCLIGVKFQSSGS